jgi:hypothetical protein
LSRHILSKSKCNLWGMSIHYMPCTCYSHSSKLNPASPIRPHPPPPLLLSWPLSWVTYIHSSVR